MEYTTPVIAAQKASPQGDAAWLAANHYAAASKQPNKFCKGCLVNKAHAIAVREPNPQGDGERNTANRLRPHPNIPTVFQRMFG